MVLDGKAPNRSVQMDLWQSEESTLTSRIACLLKNETMSDVVFLVGDDRQKFFGHKFLLGVGSQVFKAMFYGDIPEKSEVTVPDVSPTGFSIMLEYLYTDDANISEEFEAFEAAYTAKKYMISGLFRKCENFLIGNLSLTAKSVCGIYEEASLLEMKRLKETCLRYVGKNAKEFFLSETFGTASKSTLEDILRLDLVDIESESVLVQALWDWGKEQCKRQELACTRENVRELVDDLLPHIRFLSVSVQEFNELIKKCHLLDSSEEMAVLLNLALPQSSEPKMPSNFSNLSRKRSISNCTRIDIPLRYRYYGNLSLYSLPMGQNIVTINVDKGQLTILGVVLVFKPIAGYSSKHRNLEVCVLGENLTTNASSSAEVFLKPKSNREEEKHEMHFEIPLVVAFKETAMLTIIMNGEGVELLRTVQEEVSAQFGETYVHFNLLPRKGSQGEFVIKQIMCT